jgi:hypothetical protein
MEGLENSAGAGNRLPRSFLTKTDYQFLLLESHFPVRNTAPLLRKSP